MSMLNPMDPEFFPIKQAKMFGTYPTNSIIGVGLFPYIKRLKKEKISVLNLGDRKGENAFYLLENDVKHKIDKIYTVNTPNEDYDKLFKENTTGLEKLVTEYKGELVQVLCVDSSLMKSKEDFDMMMKMYYNKLEINGIICGNNSEQTHVKNSLAFFKRQNKIGNIPMISRSSWFWFKR